MVNAFLLRYKIKINDNVKHSSYLYQKLFRAIYGYTQVVCKSDGKKYVYHRPGVLSKYPFIKEGKNEVILGKEAFSQLIKFFKTGRNPAHKWQEKGNWTATYTVYDVDVDLKKVVKAVENQIKSTYVITPDGYNKLLYDFLNDASYKSFMDKTFLKQYEIPILNIRNSSWYDVSLRASTFVKKFDKLCRNLFNMSNF